MSPPLSEPFLDHNSSPAPVADSFDQDYVSLIPHASPGPVTDFYTSENLYMWHDADGIYQWVDAPVARSDACLTYSSPSCYTSPFASVPIPLSNYCGYRHDDLEDPPQPTEENSYISHLAQQFRNGAARPQVQDHRSSIARASDNFLAHASSIFTDGHSSLRRGSSLGYRPSMPHQSNQHDFPLPSRKRSIDSLDEGSCRVKQEDDHAHSSLPTTNDTSRLPQPHMIVPSHGQASVSVRIPHLGDGAAALNPQFHLREHEPHPHPEERCHIQVPKHMSNKRVHRSSEELVRQESTIVSMPTTWPGPIPDDQVMKVVKKPGEQKKQALACLFCRERKIACGRPPAHSPDQTCNQCSRRRIKCEYPTESRRGQHKRRRKPVEGEPASQSAIRTSSAVSTTTAPSSTTLTAATPPA